MVNAVDCSVQGCDSIQAEGMFSEKYLRLELSHVQIHGYQESLRQTKLTAYQIYILL